MERIRELFKRGESGKIWLRTSLALAVIAALTFGVLALTGSDHASAHVSPDPCSSAQGAIGVIEFEPGFEPVEPVKVGQTLHYRFGVKNPISVPTPGCDAFNVHVHAKLPGQAVFHEVCQVAVDAVPDTDPLIVLPADDVAVFCPHTHVAGFDDYVVTEADQVAENLTAGVKVKGSRHNQTNNCIDPSPEDATTTSPCFGGESSRPTGFHFPDVSVEKTGPKISLGEPAVFTITVAAVGKGDSLGVTLTDQLPKGGFASGDDAADAGCDGPVAPGGKLTCEFGTMSPGESRTVTVTVPTTEDNCPFISNTARVTAVQDDNPANNSSTRIIPINRCPITNPPITKCTLPDVGVCIDLFGENNKPHLANLWLCNTGAGTCVNKAHGVEEVNFYLDLLGPVNSRDPKCYGFPNFLPLETCDRQTIGAFEFEIRYDSKLLSVSVEPGSLWPTVTTPAGDVVLDPRVTCTTISTQNAIQFGCNVKGKELVINGPGTLAVVHVRATSDVYSMIIPSQLNGIVTQLINQDCNLADTQGHPIKLAGQTEPGVGPAVCDDAAVTIRYLEGDLHADCVIDIHDQQQISFRWGSQLGQLLYNSRFDLEPSAPKLGDGDIDTKDIQTVFGRHDSTCKLPHPEQPAIDPKAKVGPPINGD